MKYSYLILTLTLASFTSEVFLIKSSTYFTNTCLWIESLNNQTKQLTSDGQQIMTQILLDLQIYIGYIYHTFGIIWVS